jgi:predicted DNA-binding protein (MmcQ/YjbR family)
MPDLEWIRKLCASLPDVAETMPWADDLCFKVRGKIFTGMPLSDGRFPRITVKVAPEKFHELLEIEGISIAPYVGRYNWVTLANPNVVPAAELEALIRESYDLVASKAPRKKSVAKKSLAKAPTKRKLPKKADKKDNQSNSHAKTVGRKSRPRTRR